MIQDLHSYCKYVKMKHIILIIAFSFLASGLSAQPKQRLQIDSIVSVKLLKGFEITENEKKYNLLARSTWGTILIFKTPDDPQVTPDIEKEKHLQRYYDNYIKNLSTASPGFILKDQVDSLMGELMIKDFTLQIDTGSGIQYRSFRILHANNATYIFEYLYKDLHSEFAVPEKVEFFNSILVNEHLKPSDQYTNETINNNNPNDRKFLFWMLPLVILLLILFYFWYSRKQTP